MELRETKQMKVKSRLDSSRPGDLVHSEQFGVCLVTKPSIGVLVNLADGTVYPDIPGSHEVTPLNGCLSWWVK
jgi:hypothetical protein